MTADEALAILRAAGRSCGSHVCVAGHHRWHCLICDERFECDSWSESDEWWKQHKATCAPGEPELDGAEHKFIGEGTPDLPISVVRELSRQEHVARELRRRGNREAAPGGALILVDPAN